MKAEIYWISGVERGRLAILPRPRCGDWLEDEIGSLRLAGIGCLVSLLTPACYLTMAGIHDSLAKDKFVLLRKLSTPIPFAC